MQTWQNSPKVAIIGCGYSGLAAIRRCIEFDIKCTAFELSAEIGGLWVYEENTDKKDAPFQSGLYYTLRTNSPIKFLELPDFPFDSSEETSFVHHTEVRRYLNDFTNYFNLLPMIKFQHHVTSVQRVDQEWKISVRNLRESCDETYYFDAVMVCNGHTHKPRTPHINGIQRFEGLILHSLSYRRNNIFENKNVLLVGNGPSGIELADESNEVAKKTFQSCRSGKSILPGVVTKPEIKEIREMQVVFEDESIEAIDVIAFCTGYEYYYPFLDKSCGIKVKENGQIIEMLYKHFINIENPTMCFNGLFQRVIFSYLVDFQARAFLKILCGDIQLPSKKEMLEWLASENERKKNERILANQYYHLTSNIVEYFEDLTKFARIENIPPVFFKIFKENERNFRKDFSTFRSFRYEILNDYEFNATQK